MAAERLKQSDALYDYVLSASLREPPGMAQLVEATQQLERAGMATAPMQAQFLAFLIKAMNATRAIEVGVFTGIGTLWMADAVGPNGKVVACDVNEQYTSIGRPFWEQAGMADRIDLRLAPATQTLEKLAQTPDAGTFDFCYIDADKEAYDTYYELTLPLLRRGGVVAFDNMLQNGRVADAKADDPRVVAVRKLNKKLHGDERVDVSFLPLDDGVYLARKR